MKKFDRFWARTISLVFVGLLAILSPDWGLELRAQSLSSTSIDFGDVPVGATSSPQTITFINDTGDFDLIINGITAGGDFSFSTDCSSFLPLEETCDITVSFSPTVPGPQNQTLTVSWELTSGCDVDCQGSTPATLNGFGATTINAVDDAAETAASTPVTINVLANDTGEGLTIIDVGTPSNGAAVISGDAVIYTPAANFSGTDTFTYTIRDSFQQTATATVRVTVIPPELNAVDDVATTPAETPVTINVLANDTGEGLTVVGVTQPANGTAAISGDAVVYTPNPGFASPPDDTFTYTVRDAFGREARATVTVTVIPPEIFARDDDATTQAGQSVTINVLANDTGEGLTVVGVTQPANGSAAISGDAVVYTPNPGFASPPADTFTYTVRDRFERTATATVTVTVIPPEPEPEPEPERPLAVNDDVTTQAGQPVIINVLANDRGEGLFISAVTQPGNGSASVSSNGILYTPNPNFAGTDSFTYTIQDRFGQTGSAAVTVTVNPPGLNAVDDAATTPARTPVAINVLANDTGDGLTVISVTQPANGGAATNADGTITYTPTPNFAGTDAFTYTIRDAFGQTDSANVRVTVVAPALEASDDTAETTAFTPVVIPVLANDVGTGLVITQVGAPANGTAATNADGTITYTPASNFVGADTFTYTITDSISIDSATVTVTVTRGKEDVQKLLEETTDDPNARTIGRTIGGLCFERTASANFLRDCDALIDAASDGDPGVGAALEQITPRSLGTAADTALTSAQSQMLGVRSRMISLRSGVMGINLDRLNIQRGGWTLSGQDLRYLLASTEGGGPSADVEMVDLGPFGVFASGTINFGDRDETTNQAGFKFNTIDLMLGADYRFSDRLILGAALSYTVVDTDIDRNGGYLDTRGYGLTLYGTYYPSDQIYVEGMINYGWNDYDQRRNLAYQLRDTEVNQRFDSSYNGRQVFAELGAGYEFTRGNLTFGPDVRLSYLDVRVDDFQERAANDNPGSAWAMAIDKQNLQSLVFSLGGRASYLIDQSWGLLQPQVEFSWLHELDDNNRTVKGRFVEGAVVPDNRFQLLSDPIDKNYFRLGLGLMARFNHGPSVLIQYRTLLDYDRMEQHSISTQLRWEF
jgi:outer membrane autotransporter protein